MVEMTGKEEHFYERFEPLSPEAIARVEENIREFNRQNSHAAEMRRLHEGGADYAGTEQIEALFRRCGRVV